MLLCNDESKTVCHPCINDQNMTITLNPFFINNLKIANKCGQLSFMYVDIGLHKQKAEGQ